MAEVKLGIASIQRNRSKWIVEWLAFHMVVGFEQFYLYAHKTNDGMTEKLLKLARRYDIKVHLLDDQAQPQLLAYQHAVNSYAKEVDWLAFLDGDEFLLPAQGLHVGHGEPAVLGEECCLRSRELASHLVDHGDLFGSRVIHSHLLSGNRALARVRTARRCNGSRTSR